MRTFLRRRARLLLFGCLPLLILLGGAGWWGYRLVSKAAPPPRLVEVSRGDVEIIVAESGALEPLRKVEVKSKIAGRILSLDVEAGDVVREGQLIARIDPVEVEASLRQTEAQLRAALARLEQARLLSGYQPADIAAQIEQARNAVRTAEIRYQQALREAQTQPEVTQAALEQAEATYQAAVDNLNLLLKVTHPQLRTDAQAAVNEARAQRDDARRQLERQKGLLAKGFVSQREVDLAATQLTAAEARLQQAEQRLQTLEEQLRLQKADAESRVKQAKAALDQARAQAKRDELRQQEVETARAALDDARMRLKLAEANRVQLSVREKEVQQAQASVEQLQSALKEARTRLADTVIRAPMSGVVTQRYIESGELVTSGVATFSSGMPLVQIADLSRMRIKLQVNEVDIGKVRVGQKVEIRLDALRDEVFEGRVRKVAPASAVAQQGAPGGAVIKFPVEVEIEKPDPRMKPGMSAKCRIIVERRQNVLRLPKEALQFVDASTAKVSVVHRQMVDGKAVDKNETRTVKTGLRGDAFVEILEGLKEGEKVRPQPFTGPKRQQFEMNIGGPGEENREERRQ
ncbi:MAG: efflux RND transporter periplasmic adaptor subunit [Armatimonadota bacterium]|nr:efflux RND transporter periplasmic adaptor subunit [bacterium]MDW8319874.1 efflux RND transporter periplasmic adaptor subunit [Armatimonadota bacterium]